MMRKDCEPIHDNNDMHVLRNVVDLEIGETILSCAT